MNFRTINGLQGRNKSDVINVDGYVSNGNRNSDITQVARAASLIVFQGTISSSGSSQGTLHSEFQANCVHAVRLMIFTSSSTMWFIIRGLFPSSRPLLQCATDYTSCCLLFFYFQCAQNLWPLPRDFTFNVGLSKHFFCCRVDMRNLPKNVSFSRIKTKTFCMQIWLSVISL